MIGSTVFALRKHNSSHVSGGNYLRFTISKSPVYMKAICITRSIKLNVPFYVNGHYISSPSNPRGWPDSLCLGFEV